MADRAPAGVPGPGDGPPRIPGGLTPTRGRASARRDDEWVRPVAFVASTLTALATALALFWGALAVRALTGFGCFDGTEAACADEPSSWLSVVSTSSWVLAALSGGAVVASFALAARARRARQLVPVLLACAAALVIVAVLWRRP